jgi:hypothetical protein
MNNARLENLLMTIAQRYAPELVPPDWATAMRHVPLSDLARALADYNLLVMLGEVPPERAEEAAGHIQDWVEGYVRLYEALTRALFPSFMQIRAYYADQKEPPVVVINGTATPVIRVLARVVCPYIAARQGIGDLSDYEIRGLCEHILDELEAGDLPRADYLQVRDAVIGQIRALLHSIVRQYPLTAASPDLFARLGLPTPPAPTQAVAPAPAVRAQPAPPPPPHDLPEANAARRSPPVSPDDTAALFASPIPLVLNKRGQGSSARRPPVPDLPDSE